MKRKWERPAYATETKRRRRTFLKNQWQKSTKRSKRLFINPRDCSNHPRVVVGGEWKSRRREEKGKGESEFTTAAAVVVVFLVFTLTVFLSYYQLFIIRMEKNLSNPPHWNVPFPSFLPSFPNLPLCWRCLFLGGKKWWRGLHFWSEGKKYHNMGTNRYLTLANHERASDAMIRKLLLYL